MDKIYGLYFADRDLDYQNEGWLQDMIRRFDESGKPCILYFWWHQNPVGRELTLNKLKEILKQYKAFPVLAFSDNKLKAIFRVEGFVNVKKETIPAE